jgi:RNA polymerase sigma-70 factor (ECF subfamily)
MDADPRDGLQPDDEAFQRFEAAILTVFDQMAGVAFRILGDPGDAEDAVQSACAEVFWHWSQGLLPPQTNLPAYLTTSARNEALQILRSRKNYPTQQLLAEDLCPSAEDLEDELVARLDLLMVMRAMGELPETCRGVISMYVLGYEYQEIANFFGIKVSTVRSHMGNGRKYLRAVLPHLREED